MVRDLKYHNSSVAIANLPEVSTQSGISVELGRVLVFSRIMRLNINLVLLWTD